MLSCWRKISWGTCDHEVGRGFRACLNLEGESGFAGRLPHLPPGPYSLDVERRCCRATLNFHHVVQLSLAIVLWSRQPITGYPVLFLALAIYISMGLSLATLIESSGFAACPAAPGPGPAATAAALPSASAAYDLIQMRLASIHYIWDRRLILVASFHWEGVVKGGSRLWPRDKHCGTWAARKRTDINNHSRSWRRVNKRWWSLKLGTSLGTKYHPLRYDADCVPV